jgi:hypothetical protein
MQVPIVREIHRLAAHPEALDAKTEPRPDAFPARGAARRGKPVRSTRQPGARPVGA